MQGIRESPTFRPVLRLLPEVVVASGQERQGLELRAQHSRRSVASAAQLAQRKARQQAAQRGSRQRQCKEGFPSVILYAACTPPRMCRSRPPNPCPPCLKSLAYPFTPLTPCKPSNYPLAPSSPSLTTVAFTPPSHLQRLEGFSVAPLHLLQRGRRERLILFPSLPVLPLLSSLATCSPLPLPPGTAQPAAPAAAPAPSAAAAALPPAAPPPLALPPPAPDGPGAEMTGGSSASCAMLAVRYSCTASATRSQQSSMSRTWEIWGGQGQNVV